MVVEVVGYQSLDTPNRGEETASYLGILEIVNKQQSFQRIGRTQVDFFFFLKYYFEFCDRLFPKYDPMCFIEVCVHLYLSSLPSCVLSSISARLHWGIRQIESSVRLKYSNTKYSKGRIGGDKYCKTRNKIKIAKKVIPLLVATWFFFCQPSLPRPLSSTPTNVNI